MQGLQHKKDRSSSDVIRRQRWELVRARALQLLQKFDPDQPRDEDGKWTSGGGGGSASPPTATTAPTSAPTSSEARARILQKSRSVANKLGVSPDLISLGDPTSPNESPHMNFELNGQQYVAGGLAFNSGPLKGQAKIYAENLSGEQAIEGLAAHEVQHLKYRSVMDRYEAERGAVLREPRTAEGPHDQVMFADGRLKPPYDEKYPAYTAMFEAYGQHEYTKFADSDGVSNYSIEYWKEWRSSGGHTVSFEKAVNETLAEMARIKLETGKFPSHYGEHSIAWRGEEKPSEAVIEANAKRWRDLYRAVDRTYRMKP